MLCDLKVFGNINLLEAGVVIDRSFGIGTVVRYLFLIWTWICFWLIIIVVELRFLVRLEEQW
jgi:hypothetical protein